MGACIHTHIHTNTRARVHAYIRIYMHRSYTHACIPKCKRVGHLSSGQDTFPKHTHTKAPGLYSHSMCRLSGTLALFLDVYMHTYTRIYITFLHIIHAYIYIYIYNIHTYSCIEQLMHMNTQMRRIATSLCHALSTHTHEYWHRYICRFRHAYTCITCMCAGRTRGSEPLACAFHSLRRGFNRHLSYRQRICTHCRTTSAKKIAPKQQKFAPKKRARSHKGVPTQRSGTKRA
jgi:hypothetical protein